VPSAAERPVAAQQQQHQPSGIPKPRNAWDDLPANKENAPATTMTSSSGAGAGTRLEVGATPQTLTITSGHDGHADETRELETGAMHMGGIKAASGAQSHGCLSYPDATAAKPHRVPSGGSKPNRAEDKRRPMPMAGASSATAAASSVARPHSTVSCMPHWPLLQLLQGKPRPRP